MKTVIFLIKRNTKLFFKDKGMFFTALITPAILLVLYGTFLGNVYRDSFTVSLPEGLPISENLIESLVGSQLISSILAVSCVTVAFCSNFLMVQDKTNGCIKDLRISPVKSSALSISYYIAALLSTFLICFAAAGICLAYLAAVGWYLSAADVLRHAVLPALALGLLTAGVFIRLVRTNVISTYNSGYVEAARSRGVAEKRLLSKHAWRPALIPIITVMGMQIALMLAGAVLTETTFEWKGLGFMLSQYLKARDFVAVQGIVILIAIIVAVVNFIVDVIAALVDPRVRY